MKKVLTKDDVLAYLESLPEATWAKVRDAVAPATVKKLMLDDLRSGKLDMCEDEKHTSFYGFFMNKVAFGGRSEYPWSKIIANIPSDLGIDIPDPSPVLDIAFVPGMVVRMKTLEELRATPGVFNTLCEGLRHPSSATTFTAKMASLAGKAVSIYGVCDEGHGRVKDICGESWCILPWMVKEVIYDPANPKPYISDPDDPRVSGLMGKRVYYGDSKEPVWTTKFFLVAVKADGSEFPFGIGGSPDSAPAAFFRYIRPVEEPKVVEMTVEQICKALGKTVKIVKHQDAEE